MARREFAAATKRAALKRSGGICEDVTAGYRCQSVLGPGNLEFDHRIADQLGGEPTLENCVCLCKIHHKLKTATQDVPAIAKAKRREAAHLGIKSPSSRPITQRAAGSSRKVARIPKIALAPRVLFRKATP